MVSHTRIKISDLLLHIWQTDVVDFSWVFLDTIAWLATNGISWSLHLQSIDNSTIIARLDNVRCAINDVSDVSWESYVRKVFVTDFVAYFVLPDFVDAFNQEDDASVFLIDQKNMFIDMADMLYESVVLQTPFVKRTPAEESDYLSSLPDAMDVDDVWDSLVGWQIIFRPAKKT